MFVGEFWYVRKCELETGIIEQMISLRDTGQA